jgi:hypothetical protein
VWRQRLVERIETSPTWAHLVSGMTTGSGEVPDPGLPNGHTSG